MNDIYYYINNIYKTDKRLYEKAKKYIDSLAKPTGSLGKLEDVAAKIYSIYPFNNIDIKKRCVIVIAADNGIYEENIAATPQVLTSIQTLNILEGKIGVSVLAKQFNSDVKVCDVGINSDIKHPNLINKKIRKSTTNFLKDTAMSDNEVISAIKIGIDLSSEFKKQGYKLIGVGEMGIGNTTTSSAVLASLLDLKDEDIEKIVGFGAGLTSSFYENKVNLIKKAIKKHKPNSKNPIDILKKVGGFDLATMTGVYIGCAYNKIPVVVDGFISIVASLCAVTLNENVKDYLFLSHVSMEKGYNFAKEKLKLDTYLNLNMRLGEGSGCPIMFSIMDAAISMFNNMITFEQANINNKYLNNLKF